MSQLIVAAMSAPWPTRFPTGWYSLDGISLASLPPFGLVLNYYGGKNTSAELDTYMHAMQQHNVSVIMEVPRRWLMPDLMLPNISALATTVARHANLRGFYLADEPDKSRSAIPIATLVKARGALRAAAPHVPAFVALVTNLTVDDARAWAAAADVRIWDFCASPA